MCGELRTNSNTRIRVVCIDAAEHAHRSHTVAAYGSAVVAGEPGPIRITTAELDLPGGAST